MCGIAGIARFDGRKLDPRLLERVSDAMVHRGPDDHGYLVMDGGDGLPWCGRDVRSARPGSIALVHRRLSIIDLTPAGWQPMMSADGKHAIVFNGEIYNHLELREELAREGAVFTSRSDTEVLLQGLVRRGPDFLKSLIGMFAFALYDRERRQFLLGRDFAGMKPLYFLSNPNLFAFASEIKPLLAVHGKPPAAAPAQLHAFLAHNQSDCGGATMFADIKALPPGHYAQLEMDRPGQMRTVAYWQPDPRRELKISAEEAGAEVRRLFLDSVRLHLRSDVPLGAALSGGIDSSAIVMAMRHTLGASSTLHTFSYVAGDGAPSEEAYSDLVSQAARTVHHKAMLSPRQLAADLDSLIELQEEPFASTSVYAQLSVFRMVRGAGITVSLDGQGADEYLGGYPTFFSAGAASLLRRARLGSALRLLAGGSRHATIGTCGALARLVGDFVPHRLLAPARSLAGRSDFPPPLIRTWFQQEAAASCPNRGRGDPLRNKLIEAFTRTSLPALLRYADRNSMHVSVESRMPFLTPRLVDTVLALPGDLLISPIAETKAVFRQAMRNLVPDAVLERRDKVGFVTPETPWVTAISPWVETLLKSDTARSAPFLDQARLQHLWVQALRGERPIEGLLWRCLAVLGWARRFEVSFESRRYT